MFSESFLTSPSIAIDDQLFQSSPLFETSIESKRSSQEQPSSLDHYLYHDDDDLMTISDDDVQNDDKTTNLDFDLNNENIAQFSFLFNSTNPSTTTTATVTEQEPALSEHDLASLDEFFSSLEQLEPPVATTSKQEIQPNLTNSNDEITLPHLGQMFVSSQHLEQIQIVDSPAQSESDSSTLNYYFYEDSSSTTLLPTFNESEFSLSLASPCSSLVSSSSKKSSNSSGRSSGTGGCVVKKRESNKQAAIRYRNKKLREKDQLFAECDELAKRNVYLKKRIDDVKTQIGFIKGLLVEALIAKNGK